MNRGAEARFWQIVGVIAGVGGGLLLAYTFAVFGLASIDYRALQYGMAASFLMLAGTAAFLAGRALHVEETRLTPVEARLWNVLAAVCLIGGAVTVGFAKFQRQALALDRITIGLAGAFAMMFGVLALMGERIMAHMHDVLVVNRPGGEAEAKSKAAGA